MAVESWITPEETPALAAAATALIDARLTRLPETERTAFWASVRKCYNTPYNDPAGDGRAPADEPILALTITVEPAVASVPLEDIPLPVAAIAAAAAQTDVHAA